MASVVPRPHLHLSLDELDVPSLASVLHKGWGPAVVHSRAPEHLQPCVFKEKSRYITWERIFFLLMRKGPPALETDRGGWARISVAEGHGDAGHWASVWKCPTEGMALAAWCFRRAAFLPSCLLARNRAFPRP